MGLQWVFATMAIVLLVLFLTVAQGLLMINPAEPRASLAQSYTDGSGMRAEQGKVGLALETQLLALL